MLPEGEIWVVSNSEVADSDSEVADSEAEVRKKGGLGWKMLFLGVLSKNTDARPNLKGIT
jgi:hypothetical protein